MLSSFAWVKASLVGANTVRPGLDFKSAERLVASSAFTKLEKSAFSFRVVIRSPVGTSLPLAAAAGAGAGAAGVAAGAGVWAWAAPARRVTAAAAVSRRWIGIKVLE